MKKESPRKVGRVAAWEPESLRAWEERELRERRSLKAQGGRRDHARTDHRSSFQSDHLLLCIFVGEYVAKDWLEKSEYLLQPFAYKRLQGKWQILREWPWLNKKYLRWFWLSISCGINGRMLPIWKAREEKSRFSLFYILAIIYPLKVSNPA